MTSLAERFEEKEEQVNENLQIYQQYFEFFHQLKPSFQKILLYLFNVWQASWIENGSLSIVVGIGSRGKKGRGNKAWGIMKATGLGSTTIKGFNKYIKDFDFLKTERTQRNDGSKKDHKNRYRIKIKFFQALFLMKMGGALKSKSYRQWFIMEAAYNEEFITALLTDYFKKCPATGKKVSRMYQVFNRNETTLKKEALLAFREKVIQNDLENLDLVELNWKGLKISLDDKKLALKKIGPLGINEVMKKRSWFLDKGKIITNEAKYLFGMGKRIQYAT